MQSWNFELYHEKRIKYRKALSIFADKIAFTACHRATHVSFLFPMAKIFIHGHWKMMDGVGSLMDQKIGIEVDPSTMEWWTG